MRGVRSPWCRTIINLSSDAQTACFARRSCHTGYCRARARSGRRYSVFGVDLGRLKNTLDAAQAAPTKLHNPGIAGWEKALYWPEFGSGLLASKLLIPVRVSPGVR